MESNPKEGEIKIYVRFETRLDKKSKKSTNDKQSSTAKELILFFKPKETIINIKKRIGALLNINLDETKVLSQVNNLNSNIDEDVNKDYLIQKHVISYNLSINNIDLQDFFNNADLLYIINIFKTNVFVISEKKDSQLKELQKEKKESIQKGESITEKEINKILKTITKLSLDKNNEKIVERLKVLLSKKEELLENENKLNEIIRDLVKYKLKEKEAYEIIKDNEALAYKIYNYNNTLEKYIDKEEKIKNKEERLYEKLKTDIRLYENTQHSKIFLTFQKIRLAFSRQYKNKIIFNAFSSKKITFLKFDDGNLLKSNIYYQRLNDKDETFHKAYKEEYKKEPISEDLNFGITLESDKYPLIYNLNNEMYLLVGTSFFKYVHSNKSITKINVTNENHSNGTIIYCPYDSHMYLIGGKESKFTERIFYNTETEVFDGEWNKIDIIGEYRINFISFLINEKVIYNALGNDPNTGEYINTIQKFDTSSMNEGWSYLKIAETNINYTLKVNLKNAAYLNMTYDSIIILGGVKEKNIINKEVFLFKPLLEEFDTYSINTYDALFTPSVSNRMSDIYNGVFQSNSSFYPLKIEGGKNINMIAYGIFDSSDTCHLIDLRNNRYIKVNRHKVYSERDEEDEDESFNEAGSPISYKNVKNKIVKSPQESISLTDSQSSVNDSSDYRESVVNDEISIRINKP